MLDYYPYTFADRPAPSDDPKYKASGVEVNANFKAVLNAIAFYKQEVDVSAGSSDRNFSTSNTEYGASTDTQCNLTHLLGGLFKGDLSGGVAAGDKLGIMDTTGRFWIVTLAHDDQVSFAEGAGGTAGKCTWERLDGGAAYSDYDNETWMNTLTVWTIARATDYSNISMKVTKGQILLGTVSDNQLDAVDIPIIDTGNYFGTDNVNAALQDCGAHLGDSSDPHGATLTQTNLIVTGSISLGAVNLTGNFSVGTDKFTVAVATGNTVIAGTLTVGGATTFNANVTISGAYVLTIGTGGISASGDIATTTQVKTPQVYNAGNITIDAYNSGGDSAVYIKNSAGIMAIQRNADLYLDGKLNIGIPGKSSSYPTFFQPATGFAILYLNLNAGSSDAYFVVRNTSTDGRAWLSVQTGIKFAYTGGAAISIYKTSSTVMEFDIMNESADTLFLLKNTGTNRKANMQITGILTVDGVGTPNIGIYGNVHEVVDARDVYATLDDRLDAMMGFIIDLGGGVGAGGAACLYGQTVVVAKSGSGAQFSSIQSAINYIADASVIKPYVVLIYPGTYQEIITLKDYVYLVGIDRNSCKIEAPSDTDLISIGSAIHTGIFNLYLKDFSEGVGNTVVLVSNNQADVKINNCIIEGQAATGYGIVFFSPNVEILNSKIIADDWGIEAQASGLIQNCQIECITADGIALVLDDGSPKVLSCKIKSIGTDALWITAGGSPEVQFCDIYNSAAAGNAVKIGQNTKPKFINCRIYGGNSINAYGVNDNGNGSYFFGCYIEGGTALWVIANFLNSTYEQCSFTSLNTNRPAIDINVLAADTLKLINCTLRGNAAVQSIYCAGGKTVYMSGCTVNADVHVNINVVPGTVYETTNFKNANI